MMRSADAGATARLRAEACAVACLVRVGLRILPLARLVGVLARLPAGPAALDLPDACVEASRVAAGRAAHETCLYTSLITFALLARRGQDVTFHLGAARTPDFHAHAWVSLGGRSIEPPGDGRFVPLWQQPARRRAF